MKYHTERMVGIGFAADVLAGRDAKVSTQFRLDVTDVPHVPRHTATIAYRSRKLDQPVVEVVSLDASDHEHLSMLGRQIALCLARAFTDDDLE